MDALEPRKTATGLKERRSCRNLLVWLLPGIALLTGVGWWYAKTADAENGLRLRMAAERYAATLASAIPSGELAETTSPSEEKQRAALDRINANLTPFTALAGPEKIRLIALNKGGEPAPDVQSDPGPHTGKDPFTDPRIKKLIEDGTTFSTGPEVCGEKFCISAFSPVSDRRTGTMIAVLEVRSDLTGHPAYRNPASPFGMLLPFLPALILIGCGVLLCLRRRSHPSAAGWIQTHAEPVLCGITFLTITAVAAHLLHTAETARLAHNFSADAQSQAAIFTSKTETIRNATQLLTDFFESSEQVTPDEFRRFCGNLLITHPVAAILWIPEAEMKELSSALYIEPRDAAAALTGQNLCALPELRTAMEEASRSGQIVTTAPVHIDALPGSPERIVLVQAANGKNQRGFIALLINPAQFLHRLEHLGNTYVKGLEAALVRLTAGGAPALIACTRSHCPGNCLQADRKQLNMLIPAIALGPSYGLRITAQKEWLNQHPSNGWRLALASGLILTLLLTGITASLANRPALLEKQLQIRSGELKQSQERLEIATRSAGIGVWEYNLSENRLIWDSRMYRLYGLRHGQAIETYEAWQQCLHPDDFEKAVSAVRTAIANSTPFDTEFRIIRADTGEIRHIRAFAEVLFDSNRNPNRMIGVNFDITEKVQADQTAKNFFEQPTGINLITDFTGQIIRCNQGWLEILGYPCEELRGTFFIDLVHPDDRSATQEEMRNLENGRQTFHFENRYRHKNGEYCLLDWSAVSIPGQKLIYATARDITVQRAHEAELRQRTAELERFNKAAVGRELRMIELKKEINRLSRMAGIRPPYPLEMLPQPGQEAD